MAKIDGYYRSAITYTQNPPETNTVSSEFNYTIADNLYGNSILLYTGLIPNPNPLTGAADGDKYTAPNGVDVVEKIAEQVLTQVEDSLFGFTHSRLTHIIPGAVYGITVWSKDQAGQYTVPVPPRFYDVFFYPPAGTYVVYFKEKYAPIYQSNVGSAPSYPPAITCYRYCGPVGIENVPVSEERIYKVLNTYIDNESPGFHTITEWDIQVTEGKTYSFEYSLYGSSDTERYGQMNIWYDVSSFTDPLKFGGFFLDWWNGYALGVGEGADYEMQDFAGAVQIGSTGYTSTILAGKMFITFECQESGTLQHIFGNPDWMPGDPTASLLPGSVLKVIEIN